MSLLVPREGLKREFWDSGQAEFKPGDWSGSLRDGVASLLDSVAFLPGERVEDRRVRADRYRACGKRTVTGFCLRCGHTQFRYRVDCNIRGCERCGSRLRSRLSRAYVAKVKALGVRASDCRRVLFTYACVPRDFVGYESDWLLREVLFYCRQFFRGAVVACEVVEKVGRFWYVHVHALVVRHGGLSWDYDMLSKGWLQLAGSYVRFREVTGGDFGKAIGYMMKYALKGESVKYMSAVEYVNFLRVMYRKKLVRAFGCLYGRRKGTRGKPEGGGRGVVQIEGSGATETDILARDSTNLGLNCPVRLRCRVCGDRIVLFLTETVNIGSAG